MAIRDYAGRIFFVLSFLAFAGVIVASSQPPLLRDYPDWVYQGVLLARTLSGHPVAGYALKHYPVPNSITTVALALMSLSLGWLWAAKLWLLLYLSCAAGTIFVVARVFTLPEGFWWMLPTVLFFGQSFWFATVSFNFGICALLLLLCLLYRRRERAAPVALLLVLCFFLHLIVYAAAGLLILLYCLENRRWKLTLVGLATLPLPIWYFLGRRATPSDETALGYSPASHLAVPAIAALLFLAAVVWRRNCTVSASVGRVMVVTACVLSTITAATLFLSDSRLSPAVSSHLSLVRLKALAPFQLFGFVNIIYEPMASPLLSATLALLHRPSFLLLMLLNVLCGVALLTAIVRLLLARVPTTAPSEPSSSSDPLFLRNFVALFGLLYFFCPPNALGVISIDLRLAQLGLAAGLILLATAQPGGNFRSLPWVSVPLALLLGLSLYQFALSQSRAAIPGEDATFLPAQIASFGAVDPTAIAEEYDRLRADKLQGFIFATGLFYQTVHWPPISTGVGR